MYSHVHGACTLTWRSVYFEVQERVLPRALSMYFQVHRPDQNRPTPSVVPSPPTIRRPLEAPLGRPTERDGHVGQARPPSTAYCRLPSGAPQSGQVPALPAGSASPTTPNPAFTTKPSAAVREIPSCWAKSPNCSHRESSSLMWASWRDISNRGRGDISGEFTTSPQPLHVRLTAVCGTLQG